MRISIRNSKIAAPLFFSCNLLFFASCSPKDVQRTQHEAEVQSAPGVSATQSGEEHTSGNIQEIKLDQIHSKLTKDKASDEELIDIIKKIRAAVINAEFLSKIENQAAKSSNAAAAYLNEAFLQLELRKSSYVSQALPEYVALIKKGCNQDLVGCEFLGFFKLVYKTSDIMQIVNTQKDNELRACKTNCHEVLKAYYSNLLVSFELNNYANNDLLSFMYLKHAREYATYLETLDEGGQRTNMLRKHSSMFETILSKYPMTNSADKRLNEFVRNFKPWSYSKLDLDVFPYGTKKIFDFAAANLIYTDKKLNPEFSQQILEIQNQDKNIAKEGKSFKKTAEEIYSQNPHLFTNMKIDYSKIVNDVFYDEYFYMIDRLYNGHLDIEEVGSIWNGSNKEVSKLLNKLELYIKVSILKMIIETNQYMSDMYVSKQESGASIFIATLEKSKSLSERWMLMFNKLDTLSSFLGAYPKTIVSHQSEIEASRQMINSLKRNVKYLSVYPNMMLLTYYLSKLDGQIVINSWFGQITIKPEEVVNSLLEGKVNPWFLFGNDNYAINKFEMVFSYFFSLNTGIFDIFSKKLDEDGTPSVDRLKFFKNIIMQYVAREKNNLIKSISDLNDGIINQSKFKSFKNICSYLKVGNSSFELSFPLDELQFYSAYGDGINGIAGAGMKLYSGSGGVAATFKDLTSPSGLEKRLTLVKTFSEILKENILQLDTSSAEKENMIRTIDQQIQEIFNLRRDYFQTVLGQHRAISDCLNRMIVNEVSKQNEVIDQEIAHIGRVYDAMYDVENNKRTLSEVNSDQSLMFARGLDSIFRSDQNLTYNYNKLNFFLRMKSVLENSTPKIRITHAEDFTRIPMYRVNTIFQLKDSSGKIRSKEEFIKMVAIKMKNESDSYISWINTSNTTDHSNFVTALLQKLNGVIELYKYSYILHAKISPQDIFDNISTLSKVLNIDPIDEKRLNWIGVTKRATTADLSGLMYNEVTNEKQPIFDFLFKKVSYNTDILNDARDLYTSVKNLGSFLFAPVKNQKTGDVGTTNVSSNIEYYLKNNFIPVLYASEDSATDLASAAEALNKNSFNIRWNLESEPYALDSVAGSRFINISQNLIEDFRARMRQFHSQDTLNYFNRVTSESGARHE